MSDEIKFCRDCQFCVPDIEHAKAVRLWPWSKIDMFKAFKYAKCSFPKICIEEADYLVTGVTATYCATARIKYQHHSDRCGLDAVHFLPKGSGK